MSITDVRVRKIAKESKMRAIVSITIDDVFVVHDIKVIEGEKVKLGRYFMDKYEDPEIHNQNEKI